MQFKIFPAAVSLVSIIHCKYSRCVIEHRVHTTPKIITVTHTLNLKKSYLAITDTTKISFRYISVQ